MPADELYVSSLDLSRDGGVVNTPYVPTLRIATPLQRPDGKPFGIVIVNVDMRPAFDRVRPAPRPGGAVYVVGKNGDYFVHPDRAREFGSELGKPTDWRKDFPALAPLLGSTRSVAQTIPDQYGKPDGAPLRLRFSQAANGSGSSKPCPMPSSSGPPSRFATRR